MICWVLLCLVVLRCVYVRPIPLNKYIMKYELTSVRLSAPNVEYLHDDTALNFGQRLRVRFRYFDKEFDFVVAQSQDPFEPPIKVSGLNEKKVQKRFAFYEKESACESCLYAMGYVVKGIFTGLISVGNTSFYIEPAYYYFQNMTERTDVVIYRDVDVVYPQSLDPQGSNTVVLGEKWHVRGPVNISRRKTLAVSEKMEAACDIEVVGDDTLFQVMGSDVHHTAGFLYLHAKAADSVFRRSDLGPKTIRIITKNIEIYRDSSSETYPFKSSTSVATKFLEMYSFRVQNYCLSMCICNRFFTDDIIGLTFKADETGEEVGGICQAPVTLTRSGHMRSFNTGVITIKTNGGNRLPLAVSLRAFTHELGHAFGSDHDPVDNFMCTPGGNLGYYLMYSKAQRISTPLSNIFSPCSLRQMNRIVSTRSCLHSTEAVCGNGIREAEEECDCGDENTCYDIDPCCTPRGGVKSDRECTFKREKGYICSPKENPCCNENCMLVPSTEKRHCLLEKDICLTSFCDGENASCPPPVPSSDGTPCSGTSKTCSGGLCNSTVCKDQNMEDCTCDTFSYFCHVCCKTKNGLCMSASELGFHTADGKVFLLNFGTSCGVGNRQCDGDGKCLLPDVRNFSDVGFDPYYLISYIMIAIAVFLLFTSCMVFIFRNRISSLFARYRNGPTAPPPPQPYIIGGSADIYPQTTAPIVGRTFVPAFGQIRY